MLLEEQMNMELLKYFLLLKPHLKLFFEVNSFLFWDIFKDEKGMIG